MKLYFKYIAMLIRSTMQYRLSFFLTILSQCLNTFFEFAAMYLLIARFGSIAGYTMGEVALTFAVAHGSFSIAECVGRGFDVFSRQIQSGAFDRILVRPRSLLLQVFGSDFELARIGRIAECVGVLVMALLMVDTQWNLLRGVTVALMILGGSCIFLGIFVLGAAFAFHTVQGLEVINIFSDGGRQLTSYPINIYNKWVQRFFTFLLPFGCVNYLPLHFVVGRADNAAYALLPLVGVLFLIPCFVIWYLGGVRSYVSTGS